MTTANKALAVAARELGYTSWSDPQPGSKYGRWYAKTVRDPSFGVNNVPYCNMFVSWVLASIGLTQPGGYYAYVPFCISGYARAGQRVRNHYQAQPGDLVCFDWDADGVADHIGFIEKNCGSYVQTIEGNTTPGWGGNQSNGGGVYRRTRDWNTICAILRPKYYTPAPKPTAKPTIIEEEEKTMILLEIPNYANGAYKPGTGSLYGIYDAGNFARITDKTSFEVAKKVKGATYFYGNEADRMWNILAPMCARGSNNPGYEDADIKLLESIAADIKKLAEGNGNA